MPEANKPEGAETPQTPPQEPKPAVTPAPEKKQEPQTPPANGEEMVSVPKSKLEHLAGRNRQLRNALYSEKPEVAKELEAQEVSRIKGVLEDMVLSNQDYARVLSQNAALRTLLRKDPLSLLPADEVMYDDEDIRDALSNVLDKEVGRSAKPASAPNSQTPNTPPAPNPATPPASAEPTEPPQKKEEKTSIAEGHRQPMKRVEGSIADKLRNR